MAPKVALIILVAIIILLLQILAFVGFAKSNDNKLTNTQQDRWKKFSEYMGIAFLIFGAIVFVIADFID